ncbi:MAG: hypothetical protein CMR00_01735 [[Chlorobium] sp. 445]|nr:MAG: hypothetical protein CMR00_01735 [[Chlorobium] sp. 445]
MLKLFSETGRQGKVAKSDKDEGVVTVTVDGRSGKVLYGTSLLFGAWSAGTMLVSACYGHALCAGCLVAIDTGAEHLSPMSKTEREAIKAHGFAECDEHGHPLRLACQVKVFGDVKAHSYPPKTPLKN